MHVRAGEEGEGGGKNHGPAAAGLPLRQGNGDGCPPSPLRLMGRQSQNLGVNLTLTLCIGQSDTASVLHEALEYIRFLHEQVQVGGLRVCDLLSN